MRISLVAAVAENNVIGREGGLPWRLPADLKHFKAITMGKPIVMGRKTFESIGRPLRGRRNIIITRQADYAVENAEVAGDIDSAIALAEEDAEEIMVVGGAEIYRATLPRAGRIYLTRVKADPEGDTYFPDLDWDEWDEVEREDFDAEGDTPAYSFLVLDRRSPAVES